VSFGGCVSTSTAVTPRRVPGAVFAAMRPGARGYLLKGADTDEVVAAITAVARGEAILGRAVAQRICGFDPTTDGLRYAALPRAQHSRT
jgi:DNA-binding NarL/FixJ family response regulator